MHYVPIMDRNKFANLNFFYNVYFLHISVGRILIISNPSGKYSEVYMRSEVRGFDGSAGYQ